MTPAERKEAMPDGGYRRAAKSARVSKTTMTLVMQDRFFARTPRGLKTLVRAQRAAAREMGVAVENAFGVAMVTPRADAA